MPQNAAELLCHVVFSNQAYMLTGRLKVTDAMFPGGSPALVEPIYSSPLLSTPFNEQLAAALRDFVLARLDVRAQARLSAGMCLAESVPLHHELAVSAPMF